jgi:hypothetical protein
VAREWIEQHDDDLRNDLPGALQRGQWIDQQEDQ